MTDRRSLPAAHRHGYSCEQAEREIDAQMTDKLEAQDCLRLLCLALSLPLDELADGWRASLPIILARIETIVDEGERGFRERDALRDAAAHWCKVYREFDLSNYEWCALRDLRAALAGMGEVRA